MIIKICRFLSVMLILISITFCNTNEINKENYIDLNLVQNKISETNYYISLPEKWYVTKYLGPDFDVYYFCSKEDDSEEKTHGGLYFGNHPSRIAEGLEEEEINFEYKDSVSSKILNSNKKWQIYYTDNRYFSEHIIRNREGDSWERYLHIWANGDTVNDVIKLLYIYSTIIKL